MGSRTKQSLLGIIVCCVALVALFSLHFNDIKNFSLFIFILASMAIFIYRAFSETEQSSEGNEQLESVLNAIPGFVSWIDSNQVYLGVNKNLSDFFNMEPKDFIGKRLGTVTKEKNTNCLK